MLERNSMRSTRKQPFCWQEKKINRLLRKIYADDSGKKSKMLLLYQTLTEIDSDFNGKEISFFTKTISTYSWLSVRFIPSALEEFQDLKILKIIEKKEAGKFAWKDLIFTPDEVIDPNEINKSLNKAISTDSQSSTDGVRPTDSRTTANGKNTCDKIANDTITNESSTLDDSANGSSTVVQNTPLEDIILQEDIINKNNNKQEEEKVVLLLEWIGFNNSLIHKFIKNYSLGRIQEVVSQLSKTQSSTNPAGFVRKALEEGYVFDVTKKAAAEKKEISQKNNFLAEQKQAAKNQLESFISHQVNSWIETNTANYQEMLEEKKNKILEKSPTMKNVEILARSMTKAFIKNEVLGL